MFNLTKLEILIFPLCIALILMIMWALIESFKNVSKLKKLNKEYNETIKALKEYKERLQESKQIVEN